MLPEITQLNQPAYEPGTVIRHFSVAISDKFMKKITELPSDNGVLLERDSGDSRPEERGRLLLVSTHNQDSHMFLF